MKFFTPLVDQQLDTFFFESLVDGPLKTIMESRIEENQGQVRKRQHMTDMMKRRNTQYEENI